VTELAKVIEATLSKGGNVVCPAFAIGRTQDLLYYIREIKEKNLTPSVPDFPVYLDSPLATAATKIYSNDLTGYLDEQAAALVKDGIQPLSFEGLNFIETSEQSKALNDDRTPKVIISSSGMCDAGRVRHHLKHNLWRRECAIVFTGFQANGTTGRIIVDELSPTVTLFGEEVAIRCKIHNFRNMSAHADFDGLVKWISAFEEKPSSVYLVHGEEETSKSFANHLILQGFNAVVPKFTSIYDLEINELIFEGRDVKRRSDQRIKGRRESAVFHRLMLAGTRLIEVIAKNREGANKDLAKFADQIDALTNKWDR
jgi:metallo-beta-lactamase family protein